MISVIHFYPSATTVAKKRNLMPNYVPVHVWKASNFITEYHVNHFLLFIKHLYFELVDLLERLLFLAEEICRRCVSKN